MDDLKKEIGDVERDFRKQVSTNEKKAHENWVGVSTQGTGVNATGELVWTALRNCVPLCTK